MKHLLLTTLIASICLKVFAQGNVGVGTSDPKLKLDVAGAIGSTPGSAAAANSVTIPDNISIFRLTATGGTQTNALSLANPENGQYLTIINDDNDAATFAGFSIPGNGGAANFIYIGALSAWKQISDNDANDGWSTTGNAGTSAGTNFIGTTDNVDFVAKTYNTERLRVNAGGGVGISNVPNGGNALRVNMTEGVNASSTGILVNNFPSNTNARTGISVDMTNTSNSAGLAVTNIGATNMNGITINSAANGNGTGIRIGESTTLGTGVNIRGGTGILYNALSTGSGTALSVGGTTKPNVGVSASVSGTENTGGRFEANYEGLGLIGASFSGAYTSPAHQPRIGVWGYTASNSIVGTEIQYGIYGSSIRGGNSGTTTSYGIFGKADGTNASNNGLHVGTYGTASVVNAGTGGAIAGLFQATSNSGRHLALAAKGGGNVYLGSTDADRPANFTGSVVGVGSGNTNTTYMYHARVSGTQSFVGTTSGTVGIVAPATVTSYTLTLPSAVASANGQVLSSTTGGALSWSNPGSLLTAGTGITITSNTINSYWTLNGNNIYNNNNANNGYVGIGTGSTVPNTLTVNNSGATASTANTYAFAAQRSGSTDFTVGSDANYAYLQSWNSKPLLVNAQGNNMGVGLTTAPNVKIDADGAIALRTGSTVSITSGTPSAPQSVTVGNRSYLRITSNSASYASRAFSLTDGLQQGQILTMEYASSDANIAALYDITYSSSNADVTSQVLLLGNCNTCYKIARFVWNATDWIQEGSVTTGKTTFSYTGSSQSWTVPAGVFSIQVKLWGAGGGASGTASSGGGGGFVSGLLAVTPGETLTVIVGGGGSGSTGGFGGGGNGNNDGAGGGGRSAIRRGTADVVTAGGGGGAADDDGCGSDTDCGISTCRSGYGGAGGGSTGGSGGGGDQGCVGDRGNGGTQSAGGVANSSGSGGTGGSGSQYQGGNGGSGGCGTTYGGGGGGGGWYGGSGGSASCGAAFNDDTGGGGGGGSNYVGLLSGTVQNLQGSTNTSGGSASAANTGDADYVSGIGTGATSNSNGGNGRVVIIY